MVPTEMDVIDKCNSELIDTLANDLTTFFSKCVENKFVSREICADIRSMYGVGEREKAARLLDKVVVTLKTTKDKQAWFHDFVEVVWATSKDLANHMKLTYLAGTCINSTILYVLVFNAKFFQDNSIWTGYPSLVA